MLSNNIPKIGERVEFASRFVPNVDKILDVGCGEGILHYFVKDKVRLVYGLDNSENDLTKANKRGIKTKRIDLDKDRFPFAENIFDVITCLDVIEHVKDPTFLLSETYRVLKKNGIMILSTPNIRFSDHLFTLVLKGIFPKTSEDPNLYDGGHIHFFTFKDTCNLLTKFGFKVIIEEGIINKEKRGWKGKIFEKILGRRFMLEFRSPGILVVAKK